LLALVANSAVSHRNTLTLLAPAISAGIANGKIGY
jgi:hypothetical protein